MDKSKTLQSLIALLVLSAFLYWKINFPGQSQMWELISDGIVALTLLCFGEALFYTLVVGSFSMISKTILYLKAK